MKVVTHSTFHVVYNTDPAASPGRIEAVLEAIEHEVEIIPAMSARKEDIEAVHTGFHIGHVTRLGLYDIAALAAGGAVQAARTGLSEPCFALVRPPGHHAYPNASYGYCFFNNMAVAVEHLRREGLIRKVFVLDFDLHYGDGTEAILRERGCAILCNPRARERRAYLDEIEAALSRLDVDFIAVSAGFDNHVLDWGGLLQSEDYGHIGRLVHGACQRFGIGCFAVLEGGYHRQALEESVPAFLRALNGG